MEPLEEAGHHLDGIHARRAGDLHNDEDDADGLTDMLKGSRQRIDDVDVGERDGDAAQHKEQRIDALHANDQVAHRNDDGLERTQNHQQQPAAKVALARRKAANALTIDLEFVDGDEHVAAHPQRQVGVEGRDARAKALDRIDRLRRQLYRGCHEIGHVIDVDVHQVGQLSHRLRGLQRRDVVGGGRELVLNLGKGGVGLRQRGLCLLERGIELRQRAARACNRGGQARHDTGQIARDGGKGVKCARSLRQCVLPQIGLSLTEVGRASLNCRVERVARVRDCRSVVCHGARLCRKAIFDALQLLVLLAKRIDGRRDEGVNVLRPRGRIVGENLQALDDGVVVVDRRLKGFERIVDTSGRGRNRTGEFANRGVRRSRCLAQRDAAL